MASNPSTDVVNRTNFCSIEIPILSFSFSAVYYPLCSCVAAFALWLVVYYNFGQILKAKSVSGPFRWPVVGAYWEARRNLWKQHDWILSYFKNSKTILIDFGLFVNLFTVDPTNVEYILSTNFSNYPKGQSLHDRFFDWLGDGIFNSDGETWKRHRKVASYQFSHRNLRDFSCAVFREKALNLVRILDQSAISQQEVECQVV